MANKSSIQLIMFYMQSKEMYKLTPQLCRVAKQEFQERRTKMPSDIRNDGRFNNVLQLIESIERSEFAKATELLADAYKEHEEMINYYPLNATYITSKVKEEDPEGTAIFEEHWSPPMRPGSIPTPPLASHKLNEDDRRNWRGTSPVMTTTIKFGEEEEEQEPEAKPESRNTSRKEKHGSSQQLRTNGATDSHRDAVAYQSTTPTRLAERFQELYKMEWRTAHTELSVVLGDKQTVRHLLWIIAKASIICANLATIQLQDLENSAIGIMVSRDPLNKKVLVEDPLSVKMEKIVTDSRTLLIDYRRDMADLSIPMLKKEIRRSIASELNTTLPRRFTGIGQKFTIYADACIELIWRMYVHDPPMHIEWLTKDQEGTNFKTDLYEPYTRPGTLFDYCVWPVVRYSRDGPVLNKGVAQGR